MGRSLKKGPFVEERLMKRIDAMNAANEKKVVKTWSRASGTRCRSAFCGIASSSVPPFSCAYALP